MVVQNDNMVDLKLVLSNPPHDTVDHATAARIFGLTAAEARMRLNYPAADVWFVADGTCDLDAKLEGLRSAGARAIYTNGSAIAALSERSAAKRFAFGDSELVIEITNGREVRVPYSWRAISVVCRPVPQEKVVRLTLRQTAKAARRNPTPRQEARRSLSDMRVPVDDSFTDLYFTDGRAVHRVTLWSGSVDFSGLGPAKRSIERENVNALIAELGARFSELRDDRRLEHAPAPKIALLGRKTLRGHLETVDASLKEVDEYDLQSRLSFLSGQEWPTLPV